MTEEAYEVRKRYMVCVLGRFFCEGGRMKSHLLFGTK
jgi:hypothetical protein